MFIEKCGNFESGLTMKGLHKGLRYVATPLCSRQIFYSNDSVKNKKV